MWSLVLKKANSGSGPQLIELEPSVQVRHSSLYVSFRATVFAWGQIQSILAQVEGQSEERHTL